MQGTWSCFLKEILYVVVKPTLHRKFYFKARKVTLKKEQSPFDLKTENLFFDSKHI